MPGTRQRGACPVTSPVPDWHMQENKILSVCDSSHSPRDEATCMLENSQPHPGWRNPRMISSSVKSLLNNLRVVSGQWVDYSGTC